MIGSFSIVIAISAAIAIYFRLRNNLKLYAVFKPLTTVVIILLWLSVGPAFEVGFGLMMTLALVFCLFGDVLLLKDSYFVYGLASFLIAHILFVLVFSSFYGFQTNPFVVVALLLIGGGYFKFLYAKLEKLAFPVFLYFMAIIVMDWQAIALAFAFPQFPFFLIATGAVLFTFSDAVIAFEKFKWGFAYSEAVILGTYWLAVSLICVGAFLRVPVG